MSNVQGWLNIADRGVALIGFRGGEARTGKLGCEHLVREQRRE